MPTTKIFNGTEWIDLQGPEGPTVVSTDAGQVAKLGTDGKLLVAQADLDSRYVNITGDTMTGNLNLERDGTVGANALAINVYSDNDNAVINFRKTKGTKASPTPVLAAEILGRLNFNSITSTGSALPASSINCLARTAPTPTGCNTEFSFAVTSDTGAMVEPLRLTSSGIFAFQPLQGLFTVRNGNSGTAQEIQVIDSTPNSAGQGWGLKSSVDIVTKNTASLVASNTGKGTDFNIGILIDRLLPAGEDNYAFWNDSPAKSFFVGSVGIGWTTPTSQLEVGGSTKLRGTLDVTGDITSAGTAHSFAASSIPASAIGGNFVTLSVAGGRSSFAALSDPYAVGVRYNAASLPNYIGTASTGEFQVSAAGGGAILSITSTGNITSPGTAHSFESASIPSSAVIGSTAFTPANSAAAGTAGSMRWDENFLYVRVASGWKRVALAAF